MWVLSAILSRRLLTIASHSPSNPRITAVGCGGTISTPIRIANPRAQGALHAATTLPAFRRKPLTVRRPLPCPVRPARPAAQEPERPGQPDHRHHQRDREVQPPAGQRTQSLGRPRSLRRSLARRRQREHRHHLRRSGHHRGQAARQRHLRPVHDPDRKRVDHHLLQDQHGLGSLHLQARRRRAARHREAHGL